MLETPEIDNSDGGIISPTTTYYPMNLPPTLCVAFMRVLIHVNAEVSFVS
jgi:hypothetical protein